MKKNQIDQAVEDSMEHDLSCCLCGQPTRNRGVFLPNDPTASQIGKPPKGKTRFVIYPLCSQHPQDAGTSEAVERAIAKHFTSINN